MSATKTFTPPLPPPPQHTNRHSPVEPPPDAATHSPSLSPSTLIEFPGRSARPQWRKELSLRVREIQERRARDGGQDFITAEYGSPSSRATNGLMPIYNGAGNTDGKPSSLGLVPSTPPTPLNPIVARALERIERARRQSPHAATPSNLQIAQTTHPLTSALEASTHNLDADPQSATSTDIPERDELTKSFLDFSNENAVADAPEAAHTNTIDALSPTTAEADAPKVIAPTVAASAARDTKESNNKSNKESKLATEQSSPSASGTNDSHKQPTAQINSTSEASPSSVAATQTPAQVASRVRVTTVAASSSTKTIDAASMPQATTRVPRRVVEGVIDEAMLARREREAFQAEEAARRNSLDDRALLTSRISASVIDCLIVAFLLSPVAATVELSYGNWMDARVWYVMSSAAALLMFLYSSAATAFAGRTVGQRMLSVKPVEVSTGLSPSVSQAIKRAAFWVISFAALGLGLLYALLDSERRGIHDHLSGTIVVSE